MHSATVTHTQPKKGHIRPHPPTPNQKKVAPSTPTHTQTKKSHTYPHPPTPSQIKITLTHTHPHPTRKRSYPPTPTHTQTKKGQINPHPAKKGHYPPKSSRKSIVKKIFHYPNLNKFIKFHYPKLNKFIRISGSSKYNFRKVRCQTIGISVQYRTNELF